MFWKKKSNRKTESKPNRVFRTWLIRAFEAAKSDDLLYDWITSYTSIDDEIKNGHKIIKRRARDLANNSDLVRKWLYLLKNNVIGPKGPILQNKARDENGVMDNLANTIIENEWKRWAKKRYCTVDNSMCFQELLCLSLETLARDGEMFIRMVPNFDNDYGFALQPIDNDVVDFDYNDDLKNGHKIRFGIEYDKWSRPVTYYALQSTNDRSKFHIPIPADQMIHLFVRFRPGQKRGISWLHTAIISLRHLQKYMETELISSRAGSAKMGFFTQDGINEYKGDTTDADGNMITEVSPGTFEQLPPGVDVKIFDPQHPTTAFESFMNTITQFVSSGLLVPYASLSSNLSNVNYSSIRQGELEARDQYRMIQSFVTNNALDIINENWLKYTILKGKIKLPYSKFSKFYQPNWQWRGWHWVDPLKDMKAAVLAIENRIESREQVGIERGYDFEEMIDQLAEEDALIQQKLGLKGEANGQENIKTDNNTEAV